MTSWILGVRRTPIWFIVLSLVVFFILSTLTNLVVSPGDLFRPFCRSTGFLIVPTFLNYIPFFIVFAVLFWGVGRLRARDLGLVWKRLPMGVLWLAGTWIASQLFLFLLNWGDVEIWTAWETRPTLLVGELVSGQILGNTLMEEVFWRAFMISQLAILFHVSGKYGIRSAIVWATILSTVLFAISHLMHDVANDASLSQIYIGQLGRLAGGFVFAAIFLLSNNLFIAIGIHALANLPTPLFDPGSNVSGQAFCALAPLVLLIILAIFRHVGARRAGQEIS
ncbi:MAG: CPBP family glutamic-type intramembrane protease [Planctomycetota bacterium]|nr:CPBP family glutamic-type intramembrane protease [Planctomycetota bacterium]